MASFKLRDYQADAVSATLKHFRKTSESAVIVLPTGSGKSLVIAELARLAKRKILVLTHVKELVEQNYLKYVSYGLQASIYSAGLKQKDNKQQVTFASIQSVARNLQDFTQEYSLIIIDECHRVNLPKDNTNELPTKISTDLRAEAEPDNQYQQIIKQLALINSNIKLLGLTATPYRLGMGWIYKKHYRGIMRSEEARPFEHCIFELPLRHLIKREYLTPPTIVDATIEHYDFNALKPNIQGEYNSRDINQILGNYQRATQGIIEQIIDLGKDREGIMIFAATVEHAQEIQGYLPPEQSALIIGATESKDRDHYIQQFKNKDIKFLVNVSVLTTGFDAPHVDFIAILRPTQSVSLYQQIIGRGLRLAEGKKDCLVIDYTGNDFDLYQPEVGEKKPNSQSQPVQVMCPSCNFPNIFWGILDDDNHLVEHYGRRCQGIIEEKQCDYRFVFKECPDCGQENDIAARKCTHCLSTLVDPDDMLKKALQLKDAKVIRCSGMTFEDHQNKLKVIYHDEEGAELSESFDLNNQLQRNKFNQLFAKRLTKQLESLSTEEKTAAIKPIEISSIEQALALQHQFTHPDFVIARKQKYYWRIKERIFDYQGNYRKANALG